MRAKLITAPATEPVSLAEAKLYLKQDATDDDALITSLIASSRQWCEAFTRRALIAQVWELTLDAFPVATRTNPRAAIVLPKGVTSAVASITYIDTDGAPQTLSGPTSTVPGTDYQEDFSDDAGGLLCAAYGTSWPSTRDVPGAVKVQFTAGYAVVPGQLRDAILYRLASLYENRGEQDTKDWQGVAEAFASPYTVDWFGQ